MKLHTEAMIYIQYYEEKTLSQKLRRIMRVNKGLYGTTFAGLPLKLEKAAEF